MRPAGSTDWKRLAVAALFVAGAAARVAIATRGHNYDVDSYWIVGRIGAAGGNVYRETDRYNYGPVWFGVLATLYGLGALVGHTFVVIRYGVVVVLTFIDVGIAVLLWKRYGRNAAVLFFCNPVSILITGYHSQFENVAILLALAGAIEKEQDAPASARLVFAGSLATKHIILAFMGWLALRPGTWRERASDSLGPLAIAGALFLPFIATGGWSGIARNVIGYRSFANAPLLSLVLPGRVPEGLAVGLVVAALTGAGIATRRSPLPDALLVYLVVLVAFAPAVANQYLVIPVAALAARPSVATAVYTLFVTLFLLGDADGMHLWHAPALLHRNAAYTIATVILVSHLILSWRRGSEPPALERSKGAGAMNR